MTFPHFHSTRRGSALLIALWAIVIMTVAVLGLVEFANLGLDENAARGKGFRALQLAESGLALGLHPKVKKQESLLHQKLAAGESFDVLIRSEGGRLNINALVQNKQTDTLVNLFNRWGVDLPEAQRAVDCLADWVDADGLKKLNGAERKEYEEAGKKGLPPNRPFQSVDEMDRVRGMDAVTMAKPDWRAYFTVWGDGKLDLNEAPADLVAAVCGVGSAQAESLVAHRLGADREKDTADDMEFTDWGQVQAVLGISADSLNGLQDRISLKSDYRRIESTGRIGSYRKTIVVVTRINSNPVQYLSWLEQ